MKDTDIAWAAGFIDGEGHIGYKVGLSLIVGQRVREPLDRLVSIFNVGKVRLTPVKYKGEIVAHHVYTAHCDRALVVLRLVFPHLVVKKCVATLAIKAREKADKTRPKALKYKVRVVGSLRAKGLSYTSIGRMMGISRQRAHQLGRQAPVLHKDEQIGFFKQSHQKSAG